MQFRVHSVTTDPQTIEIELPGGAKVPAQVAGLTVELVQVDGDNTITRRFVSEDMDADLALFAEGNILDETFTPAEE